MARSNLTQKEKIKLSEINKLYFYAKSSSKQTTMSNIAKVLWFRFKGMTFKEIGTEMKLSRQWVRQLESFGVDAIIYNIRKK